MGLGLVLFAKGRYSEAASAFRGCELETARLHLLRVAISLIKNLNFLRFCIN